MEHSFGFFEEDQLGNIKDTVLWRRIFKYVMPQKKGIILSILLSFAIIGASLTLPYLIKLAIDNYILNTSIPNDQRVEGLFTLASIFVVLMVIAFAANFFQVTLLEWTGQNIMHRLRQHLFSHLLSLDLTFFNSNPGGKLVTRLTNDIQNMHEMFTSVIVTLFNDFVQMVGILFILYWMNINLAVAVTLLLPFIILNSMFFSRMARDAFRSIRTNLAAINSFLHESLYGISLIQHFIQENDTKRKFEIQNQQYTEKTIYQIKLFGVFLPLIEVISSAAIALIIWYGGGQVIQEQMSIGVMAAFLSYMRLFFRPVREISQKYSIVQSAMASAERIFELIDRKNSLADNANQTLPYLKGKISFENVSFSYKKDEIIIKNLHISINPGETLAIVGPTGSGKTTVINLLERLYDPDSGTICLDNKNIKHFDIRWLRNQIGLVIQDVFLTSGSFYENLCFGQKISPEKLDIVLRKSQLSEVVNKLPNKIHTKIGEGAYELSTGQKQLLALARVLIRDPKILVLDEATANIDSYTEMLLEQAINETVRSRTSIIIAHRLSTIHRADRIAVLDKGEIVEIGSYQQLLNKKGLFFTLVQQQELLASKGSQ